jgi:hypothetical protein
MAEIPTRRELLEAALVYAARGWAVLPLRAGRKAPHGRLVPHGLWQASTDEAVIRRWWAAVPDANVGIRTGEGLDVLDIDGPAALDAVLALSADTGWAFGPVVSTGQGWHVYLRSGELRTRTGIQAGVDIRARGAYVVAPPSIHPSGARYAFFDSETGESLSDPPAVELPEPPAWLVEQCRPEDPERRPVRPAKGLRSTPESPARLAAYAWAAMENECARVATTAAGSRNHRLNVAAFSLGTLVGAGALEAGVVELMLAEAARAAGLGAAEARRTLRSGLGAGVQRPRQLSGPVVP